jgi:hypothetical protein
MFNQIPLLLVPLCLAADADSMAAAPIASVVVPSEASVLEVLAAREVRRYVYLRTGALLQVVTDFGASKGDVVLVGRKDRRAVREVADVTAREPTQGLAPQEYLLRRLRQGGRNVLLIAGGDELGALYGAYRFAEHLGVRFYLDGDVVPDARIRPVLPAIDDTGRPLFNLRGIHPFHDFPEGPDWWNLDDYKAILAQLAKLRMNFIGFHCYPRPHAEPLVWVGRPEEVDADGHPKRSFPARHFTTAGGSRAEWGYSPMRTSAYVFGADQLFDRDDFCADAMRGMTPGPETPEACNELFIRVGDLLSGAFSFAHRFGIKTCIGTETPMDVPKEDREKLYEGIFLRIQRTHPLDYYWLWTPETWTLRGASEKQVEDTVADLKAAVAAARNAKAPFTLATCGWVLGPSRDRALFDRILPKEMPMSCINRQTGYAPLEPGLSRIDRRPKWAIPWLEDDSRMAMPQLWAGRMRRDAADAHAYGCTGLMGIHWRTRILGPNISALAAAAWDQKGWNPDLGKRVRIEQPNTPGGPAGGKVERKKEDLRPRGLPVDGFYLDWARSQFGPHAAKEIAALFTRLDGKLPLPTTWVVGPGGIKPNSNPWEEVGRQYVFADELAVLRPRIKGAGNLDRFDYWVHQFRYMRATMEHNCVWYRFEAAMKEAREAKEQAEKQQIAREKALPLWRHMVGLLKEVHLHLLASTTTTGGMGNVANWQQHIIARQRGKDPRFQKLVTLADSKRELAEMLGGELPPDAAWPRDYPGPARLFVPTVRGSLEPGEKLRLTVIMLGLTPVDAAVLWRPLGQGEFAKLPLTHAARGVYRAELPGEATKSDFEYYVQATSGKGERLCFPPTAPELNQTVVIFGSGVDGKVSCSCKGEPLDRGRDRHEP